MTSTPLLVGPQSDGLVRMTNAYVVAVIRRVAAGRVADWANSLIVDVGRVELSPAAKELPIFGAAAWLRVTVHHRLAGTR